MGVCDKKTTFEILDYFYESGGNFIDTSNNYQVPLARRDMVAVPNMSVERGVGAVDWGVDGKERSKRSVGDCDKIYNRFSHRLRGQGDHHQHYRERHQVATLVLGS